jgi:hypothetical protein
MNQFSMTTALFPRAARLIAVELKLSLSPGERLGVRLCRLVNVEGDRGVFGLPVAFLIGRDDRIYFKHVGEADVSLIEREIKALL